MYRVFKRCADVFCSVIGLLIITPVFLPLMFLLRITGEGEVFYRQERMGYRNKPFGILKFATMLKNSLNIGSKTVTVRNDPRITPLGKYLRFTKMNELPQVLNVVLGDMSVVGPRPLLVSSFKKYALPVQERIYQNRPGITGVGSLVFRDEEKLVSAYSKSGLDPLDYYREYIYPYKGALELWYAENISLKTDFAILMLTFWSLIRPDAELVYRVFPSLPTKPQSLTPDGIRLIISQSN